MGVFSFHFSFNNKPKSPKSCNFQQHTTQHAIILSIDDESQLTIAWFEKASQTDKHMNEGKDNAYSRVTSQLKMFIIDRKYLLLLTAASLCSAAAEKYFYMQHFYWSMINGFADGEHFYCIKISNSTWLAFRWSYKCQLSRAKTIAFVGLI